MMHDDLSVNQVDVKTDEEGKEGNDGEQDQI